MARSRDIEVKIRINKEGQTQIFREMAEEVGHLAPAAQQAEQAVDKLGASVENNFRGSFRATTNAKFALEQYQKQIQAVQDAGGVVSPGQLARLEQLESRYDGLIGTVGEYRAAHQRTADEVKKATAAAGGHGDAIRSLDDLIEQLAGQLGSGVAKWTAWGAAAVGAFKVGWEAGEKLRGVLNSLTDGDFDRNVQESFAGIARAIVGTADQAKLLENQMNVLAKNGIDVAGKSAEEVGKLFEEFTGKLRDNATEVSNAEAAYAAWREELGPVSEDLDKMAEALLANIAKLQETEQQLSGSEFAALVGPQIDALVAEYERLGVEAPESLQKMSDAWGTAAEEVAKSTDEVTGKLQQLEGEFETYPGKATDLSQSTIEIVEAFDAAGNKIQLVTNRLDEAGEEIKEVKVTEEGVFTNLTEGAEEAGESTTGLTETVDEATGKITAVTNVTEEAGKALQEIKVTEEGVFTQTKEGAEGAAEGLGHVAASTDDVAGAQPGAQTELEKTTAALEEVATTVEERFSGAFLAAFEGIADEIAAAFADPAGFAEPFIAEIEKIQTAAEAAAKAVAELRQTVDTGEAPSGPPN